MPINTTYRSNAPEIMDDFDMSGEMLRDALDKIAKINRLLGGNKVTLQGVERLINSVSKDQEITIVDLGCGNGDMLRKIADYGIANNRAFKLIGIDANNFTVEYAKSLSDKYTNIDFLYKDIFDVSFEEMKYDIALCTLTLHHFSDKEIMTIMTVLEKQARLGIVINDLHRSGLAYQLFRFICFIFNINEMPKKDGLSSILKGFKRNELVACSDRLNLKNYKIQWKWAFRYQWIISKV